MSAWPALDQPTLAGTCETLQLWSQIAGKARLAASPWLNHSWHVPLYVSARGLTTGLVTWDGGGFELEFDFTRHRLDLITAEGWVAHIALAARPIADFHRELTDALKGAAPGLTLHPAPSEMPEPVPFAHDHRPRVYDPDAAHAYWRALVSIQGVLQRFRTGFLGKCSPIHLFWGAFDLAVTRFSGRPAPRHPGGVPHLPDAVTREAYSHEVSSAGFWPGGGAVQGPHFYAYAYPAPPGFAEAPVRPAEARYDPALGEFLLPYATVRADPDPEAALMAFLETTYAAAAELGRWDRQALECGYGAPGVPRPA